MRVEIVGRIITRDGRVIEQVLGAAEGDSYYEVSVQLEPLLTELAETWPEVVAEGIV